MVQLLVRWLECCCCCAVLRSSSQFGPFPMPMHVSLRTDETCLTLLLLYGPVFGVYVLLLWSVALCVHSQQHPHNSVNPPCGPLAPTEDTAP
jgi:hypothetical protein